MILDEGLVCTLLQSYPSRLISFSSSARTMPSLSTQKKSLFWPLLLKSDFDLHICLIEDGRDSVLFPRTLALFPHFRLNSRVFRQRYLVDIYTNANYIDSRSKASSGKIRGFARLLTILQEALQPSLFATFMISCTAQDNSI